MKTVPDTSAFRAKRAGADLRSADSLTTYSPFSYETLRLAQTGTRFHAAVNIIASIVAGLGAAYIGVLLAATVS